MLILFAIRRTICFVDDHTKISARLKIELIHNWFLSLPSLPSKSVILCNTPITRTPYYAQDGSVLWIFRRKYDV
ncbi:unnamed protein product [Rhizophagus irregularis]|nr:unnamed protein product [Rhizophagus irregularis]